MFFFLPKITLFNTLIQAWATSGPRATYGPPSTLMWPASYVSSFINSYLDLENTLTTEYYLIYHKNNLKISLHGPIPARDTLLVSNVAHEAKRVAHPCFNSLHIFLAQLFWLGVQH